MGLPKNKLNPDSNYTYPSMRDYFDETKSTLGNGQVTDTTKSGADYEIKDPEKTKAVAGAGV